MQYPNCVPPPRWPLYCSARPCDAVAAEGPMAATVAANTTAALGSRRGTASDQDSRMAVADHRRTGARRTKAE